MGHRGPADFRLSVARAAVSVFHRFGGLAGMLTAMKIGIRLESLALPLRKGLDQAVRMGAAGVQIDAIGDLLPDRLSQTGRREFANLLRSLNLELAALSCPLRRGLDVA